EPPIEFLDRLEYLGVTEVRVVQGRGLRAEFAEQSRRRIREPAVCQRLVVKKRSWIGRGQRDLNRVRVDLSGEPDRLFDGFLGLAWKAEDECAVDGDSEFVAILCEPPGYVDPHALLDIVQDLLITRLVAD